MPTQFESTQALQMFLSKSSKDEFEKTLPLLSLTDLADTLTLLQTQPTLEAKGKLDSLFQFISSSSQILEALGKNFSSSFFLHFLEFLAHHSEYQPCLGFILEGLSPSVFSQTLHVLKPHHLDILKKQSLFEPLQYQLTQFFHEGESIREEIDQKMIEFQQQLPLISPKDLTAEELKSLFDQIDACRNRLTDYLKHASTALLIVWHTNRIDLIEKLSLINESIQHQLTHFIGHPALQNSPATGLYAILTQTLSQIFDSSLENDDAAIEGITRLSVWHLKDYWELGLLPSIHNLKELEFDSQKEDEEGQRQQLMSLVQKQLDKLGISKVADLKKFNLFSKSLLKHYIEQHQKLS